MADSESGKSVSTVAIPCVDLLQVISAKSLLTRGLCGVYEDVLLFIPDTCSLLLDITRATDPDTEDRGGTIVKGFDFLVNSVWPEIVSSLEKKVSVIFAPGNPDTFHKVPSFLTCITWSFH